MTGIDYLIGYLNGLTLRRMRWSQFGDTLNWDNDNHRNNCLNELWGYANALYDTGRITIRELDDVIDKINQCY